MARALKQSPTKKVWVFHDNKWYKGHVSSKTKKKAKVCIDDGATVVKDAKFIMTQKYNGRTFRNGPSEVVRKYGRCKPRPEMMKIESIEFKRPGEHGDIGFHLQNSAYDHIVHIYNENAFQFLNGDKSPGGGNAIARPYRGIKAFGIPTGDSGGFRSLNETVSFGMLTYTAKELIDMSITNGASMIAHSIMPFDTIYYCTDSVSKQTFSEIGEKYNIDPIGIRIFAHTIGEDVVDYITQQITTLPKRVHWYRTQNRYYNVHNPVVMNQLEILGLCGGTNLLEPQNAPADSQYNNGLQLEDLLEPQNAPADSQYGL
jgi:hypothetical protein